MCLSCVTKTEAGPDKHWFAYIKLSYSRAMNSYRGKTHEWLRKQTHLADAQGFLCGCVYTTHSHVERGADKHISSHCLHMNSLVDFRCTKTLACWEFETGSSCMQTGSCSHVLAVLSSITAVWKRMHASSHSHSSAIHYSTLAMDRHFLPHPQWIEHHITTVNHNSYTHFCSASLWVFTSHRLYFVCFRGISDATLYACL